ncbi:hypothetical protein N201_01955 [Helicobacter pylori UM066]|nr:hypothetical protein N201_01955 [Helicobacter pylori UM066]
MRKQAIVLFKSGLGGLGGYKGVKGGIIAKYPPIPLRE